MGASAHIASAQRGHCAQPPGCCCWLLLPPFCYGLVGCPSCSWLYRLHQCLVHITSHRLRLVVEAVQGVYICGLCNQGGYLLGVLLIGMAWRRSFQGFNWRAVSSNSFAGGSHLHSELSGSWLPHCVGPMACDVSTPGVVACIYHHCRQASRIGFVTQTLSLAVDVLGRALLPCSALPSPCGPALPPVLCACLCVHDYVWEGSIRLHVSV